MEKKVLLLVVLGMHVATQLDAYCENKVHKNIRGKRNGIYHCSIKPRDFYASSKNPKRAAILFDQAGNCKTCGCANTSHKK
jgi:hypothetical protein